MWVCLESEQLHGSEAAVPCGTLSPPSRSCWSHLSASGLGGTPGYRGTPPRRDEREVAGGRCGECTGGGIISLKDSN